ncbi:MAG: 5-formyltetrahydrofolate cyclo-ligase [Pelagibacteraceae bacterium]
MLNKDKLRKKFSKIRQKNYFNIDKNFFPPLINQLKKKFKKKTIYLSIYYPSNFEVDLLKLLELIHKKKNIITLLPAIKKKNNMNFYKWKSLEILKVNKYGMLEPNLQKKSLIPNVAIIPLLAFDKNNHRLGYGKGFYDNYLNKYLKKNKKILTVGVAFSFQKYDKLPVSSFDVKMNYILTEKGIIKK